MFVAEAGAGPTIVLVHGIYAGSSSYEFRKLAPLLAKSHRVLVFDFLGCGLSARPKIRYSADLFARQLADFIGEFAPESTTLVASSLGGAFAVRAVARMHAGVSALVLICPTGLAGTLDGKPSAFQRAIKALIMTPAIGQAFFDGLASRPSLRWFLKTQAYANASSISSDVIAHYWATTHRPGSRFVPAHFVGGALNCSIAQDLPRIAAPILVAWGRQAATTSPFESAGTYVSLAQRGELAVFERSRLLPQEEQPDALAARVADFIAASTEAR